MKKKNLNISKKKLEVGKKKSKKTNSSRNIDSEIFVFPTSIFFLIFSHCVSLPQIFWFVFDIWSGCLGRTKKNLKTKCVEKAVDIPRYSIFYLNPTEHGARAHEKKKFFFS